MASVDSGVSAFLNAQALQLYQQEAQNIYNAYTTSTSASAGLAFNNNWGSSNDVYIDGNLYANTISTQLGEVFGAKKKMLSFFRVNDKVEVEEGSTLSQVDQLRIKVQRWLYPLRFNDGCIQKNTPGRHGFVPSTCS
jgi:hypothetical protein